MPQFSFDLASRSDHRACRDAIRQGSKSFYAASRLLPADVRQRAFALYAFCRLSDDAVDLSGGSKDAVVRLRERLARAAQGRPLPFAADRAMADLFRRTRMPTALPEALLEGLAWDAEGRTYETLDELFDYAARVAGAVGVMMTVLMGVRSTEALARANDLGVAMQLTNIARDVGEDARMGRIYLPRQWLREAGVDAAAWLADPRPDPRVLALTARLLDEARGLYDRARSGVALLPANCRPAILAAALIYAEIGAEVARNGFDSVSARARVSGRRKLELLGRATLDSRRLAPGPAVPAAPCGDFLLDAVANGRPAPKPPSRAVLDWRDQFIGTLQTFERLHRADRLQA
ncbi:phytoene synthase [Roseiarcus fermentans]|uniref:Phytoene synthase n=1 Tax=Roseiarcus fermentans TaxID=1473586 RepID=A0A366F9M1_9HYPH|nr:phytoene/squalene synthase family protein [Roseiarcus fermentans]RBP11311.1 phytoene synthase [Roseiarcus fermentans]